jgi:hypothetical protein
MRHGILPLSRPAEHLPTHKAATSGSSLSGIRWPSFHPMKHSAVAVRRPMSARLGSLAARGIGVEECKGSMEVSIQTLACQVPNLWDAAVVLTLEAAGDGGRSVSRPAQPPAGQEWPTASQRLDRSVPSMRMRRGETSICGSGGCPAGCLLLGRAAFKDWRGRRRCVVSIAGRCS